MADFRAVVIGGSAGSYAVVSRILAALPVDYPVPVIVCMHRLKHVRAGFIEALNERSNLNVVEPYDKQVIERGNVYVAPANYHMFIDYFGSVSLSVEDQYLFCRPAIDYTLASAAKAWRSKTVGVILTGANQDGADIRESPALLPLAGNKFLNRGSGVLARRILHTVSDYGHQHGVPLFDAAVKLRNGSSHCIIERGAATRTVIRPGHILQAGSRDTISPGLHTVHSVAFECH